MKMEKIGVIAPYWSDLKIDELKDFTVRAEKLGYDSAWIPEMWGRDPLSLLTMLAATTSKIRLCTGIISVFNRTPATIASAMATLDEITGGRAVLGLGASGSIVIENWHGIEFKNPLQRTREYIEIRRLILSGKRVNYSGKIFDLRGFKLQFTPPRAEIPIFVAAMGPKNVELAGELADGWIPFLIPHSQIASAKELLEKGAQRSSRNLEQLSIAPYIPACVHDDIEAANRVIKEHIAHYVGGMGVYYAQAISRWGFETEAQNITQAYKESDKKKAIEGVSDELLKAVSVSGDGSQARDSIERFRKAGADLPILMFPPKATREMVLSTLEELAPSRSRFD